MGTYHFVFEINGNRVGTCTEITGLDEVGHKVQPEPAQPGDLTARPVKTQVGLLLPAVQKVRSAAARSPIKLGHKLDMAGSRGGSSASAPGARLVPSQVKVLPLAASTPAGAALTLHGFQPEPGSMNWVAEQGQRPQPRSGILSLRDERDRTVAQWTFFNAWPSKVSGPQVKSDSNDVGVEELTLAFEGFQRTL